MKNFVQPGVVVTLTAPSGGVVAGAVYKIGAFIVVASATVAAGLPFEGQRLGVFDIVSDTGTAWAEGDTLYWDDTNKRFTKTATSNTKAGLATTAKASGVTSGQIVFVPSI